jgi:hypothetical protein
MFTFATEILSYSKPIQRRSPQPIKKLFFFLGGQFWPAPEAGSANLIESGTKTQIFLT